MSVKEGDKVLLPSFGGQSVKVGEDVSPFSAPSLSRLKLMGEGRQEFHIFRDSEILARLSE